MRDIARLCLKLLLIAAIAGLALGFTNEITKAEIERQTLLIADAARKSVMSEADGFTQISATPDGIDNAYECTKGADIIGYIAQVTVKGYGGTIEVMVGMNTQGEITGINVGGANFSETAGLGARAKEPKFTDQFVGLKPPAILNDNIDAISAATITSTAVVKAVNTASEYIMTLLG